MTGVVVLSGRLVVVKVVVLSASGDEGGGVVSKW